MISTLIDTKVAFADLKDGLVAYYPFNGNANDESGNGNNGTVYGATLTTDRFGNANSAYDFDGNDNIVVPDSNTLDLTTHFTLAAWVKPHSLMNDPAQGGIISKNGDYGVNNGYQLGITNSNTQIWCLFNADGESWPGNKLLARAIVPVNEWSHIACTYDNDTLRIFHNGILVGSKVIGAKSVANSSSSLRISSD